jgi:hypothetical protein
MLDVWQISLFFSVKATDKKWTQLNVAEEFP